MSLLNFHNGSLSGNAGSTHTVRRDLFEEAYSASADFRVEIPRKVFEKAEGELMRELPQFPRLWNRITRPAEKYPQVIANRQAFILLYAKADGHSRKNDKDIASWIHSAAVDEIFLTLAERMAVRRAPISDDQIDDGITEGALHDTVEEFDTTPAIIEKLFGSHIALGISRVTTPKPEELLLMYPGITEDYITITKALSLHPRYHLNRLQLTNPSNYRNLKAALKLEHKNHAAEPLTLVEDLLRGSDNAHFFISDTLSLRAGNIYIHPRYKPFPESPPENGPKPIRELQAYHSIADRSAYQTTLYARLDKLRAECADASGNAKELRVFDVAKLELHDMFEQVLKEYKTEVDKSLNPVADGFTVQKSITRRAVESGARSIGRLAEATGKMALML